MKTKKQKKLFMTNFKDKNNNKNKHHNLVMLLNMKCKCSVYHLSLFNNDIHLNIILFPLEVLFFWERSLLWFCSEQKKRPLKTSASLVKIPCWTQAKWIWTTGGASFLYNRDWQAMNSLCKLDWTEKNQSQTAF